MCDVSTIPGLTELWDQTRGDDRVRVAMVDGPVDLGHPAFAGASVRRLDGVWSAEGFAGPSKPSADHTPSRRRTLAPAKAGWPRSTGPSTMATRTRSSPRVWSHNSVSPGIVDTSHIGYLHHHCRRPDRTGPCGPQGPTSKGARRR